MNMTCKFFGEDRESHLPCIAMQPVNNAVNVGVKIWQLGAPKLPPCKTVTLLVAMDGGHA